MKLNNRKKSCPLLTQSPINVVVGKKYLVPSGMSRSTGRLLAIVFPSHSDEGLFFSKNPPYNDASVEHYHIDHRFTNYSMATDAWYAADLHDIKLRNMVCISTFTSLINPFPFTTERLHQLYQNHTLINNRCPHQGSQIVNQCGTCPSHALIWDLETGKLKYKLPFKLRIVGTEESGRITDGKAVITMKKKFKVEYPYLELELLDVEGKIYPNCLLQSRQNYNWDGLTINPGDSLTIAASV